MDRKAHWEEIYAKKQPTQLTWYQPHPQQSLQLIAETGVPLSGQIIDVGGGTSPLVDFLLEAGYRHLTVLDIADLSLKRSRARLGERAQRVTWITADITAVKLPKDHYDIWHDRAVFHFLSDALDCQNYMKTLYRSLRPGGHVILSTFASDGPSRCSGLDVMRYGDQDVRAAFGQEFDLLRSVDELHPTPWDTTQKFTYFHLRRSA